MILQLDRYISRLVTRNNNNNHHGSNVKVLARYSVVFLYTHRHIFTNSRTVRSILGRRGKRRRRLYRRKDRHPSVGHGELSVR